MKLRNKIKWKEEKLGAVLSADIRMKHLVKPRPRCSFSVGETILPIHPFYYWVSERKQYLTRGVNWKNLNSLTFKHQALW